VAVVLELPEFQLVLMAEIRHLVETLLVGGRKVQSPQVLVVPEVLVQLLLEPLYLPYRVDLAWVQLKVSLRMAR
jgi:hypothetical protein